MLRMLRLSILATTVIAVGAFAQTGATFEPAPGMSVLCMYITLNQSRAAVRYCERPWSDNQEKSYTDLNSALEQFIRANAGDRAAGLIAAYGEDAAQKVTTDQGESICKQERLGLLMGFAYGMTGADGAVNILKRLKTSQDPTEGACF